MTVPNGIKALSSLNFIITKTQRWPRKFFCKSTNRKSANSWVSQSQIRKFWGVSVRKWQIRKFVMINPKIANPQIYQSANPEIRKFLLGLLGLPLILTFYLRKYILDYDEGHFILSQNGPKSQKSSLNLNESSLSLYVWYRYKVPNNKVPNHKISNNKVPNTKVPQ